MSTGSGMVPKAIASALGAFLIAFSAPVYGSITLDILPSNASGSAVSVLHSGTQRAGQGNDIYLGTPENGPRKSGYLSERLGGSLTGNWNSSTNMLTGITGEITTRVGNLWRYRSMKNYSERMSGIRHLTSNDLMRVVINGGGMLFGVDGEYVGGWLSYEMQIYDFATSAGFVSVNTGNFFFKPQKEARGSDPLAPNRGSIDEFHIWGNNWMHDGMEAGSYTRQNRGDADDSDWDFLAGLGYTGSFQRRYGLDDCLQWGLDMYAMRRPGGEIPEPGSLLVWTSVLGIGCLLVGRRRRRD